MAAATSQTLRERLPWILVAATPLTAAAGFLLGARWLLPLLTGLPAYAAMAVLLGRGRRLAALRAMLVWALLLGASVTCLSSLWPARAGQVVIHGAEYWSEMSGWLETGQGIESDPARFVPRHALHASLFVALSLATGSLVSIVFGAALMNYMSYYVAQVVLSAPAHPLLAGILAWHPWSVVRVVSFVILGVFLAEPVLSRVQRRPTTIAEGRWWIGIAAGGLVIDIVLKAILAPHWHALLRSLR